MGGYGRIGVYRVNHSLNSIDTVIKDVFVLGYFNININKKS